MVFELWFSSPCLSGTAASAAEGIDPKVDSADEGGRKGLRGLAPGTVFGGEMRGCSLLSCPDVLVSLSGLVVPRSAVKERWCARCREDAQSGAWLPGLPAFPALIEEGTVCVLLRANMVISVRRTVAL